MGTGWRRAFRTRDPESTTDTKHISQGPTLSSPRTCVKLGFLSSSSNPSTPTLQQQPQNATAPKSNTTSPRSPNLKLSLFKNSFKSRSGCGMCSKSVKRGQGKAIYTAECGHAFHFPCIAAHSVSVCPVCNATWKDVALFQLNDDVVKTVKTETNHLDHNSVRSYDDDEPLSSPLFGSSEIVPIPEGKENGEEEEDDDDENDAGEFRGCFVKPKPLSTLQVNDDDSRSVLVKLMPECAVISVSPLHETHALVLRVKAPAPPPQRAPMDLVAVLDVGGNMSVSKLHTLKRAMRLVISSLGSADRLAIVAFSASSKRLLPLLRMTAQGQRVARRVVDRLVCGQGNSVDLAMRKATKVLQDRRERNPIARLLLLSEESVQTGNSNNTDQRKCSSHVSSNRMEFPVHSFGFGTETGLSRDPVEDDFAKFFGELVSVVVQDLRIQLAVSSPVEISAVYSCNGRPTALSRETARLGDLYASEERELLVELKVPTSAVGKKHVMTVRCICKDPAREELVCGREHALPVGPPVKNAWLNGGRIERLRNVFITSRAVAESRRLVEYNEFSSAHHLLASARALLVRSGSALAEEYVRGLEAEIAELQWQKQQRQTTGEQRRREREREMRLVDENGEALTPMSAWRAAEKLAKMAMMKKKSLNRVSDLHGFENAGF